MSSKPAEQPESEERIVWPIKRTVIQFMALHWHSAGEEFNETDMINSRSGKKKDGIMTILMRLVVQKLKTRKEVKLADA